MENRSLHQPLLALRKLLGNDELYEICARADTRLEIVDWLTEQTSIKEYRERWIPLRDLLLEISVIGLIGWEIYLGYAQEKQQAENFKSQQEVLTNLNASSKATSDTLSALKQTTDLELAAMQASVGAAQRSAKASEDSAATAAKSLLVSERAYMSLDIRLLAAPKSGEKLHFKSIIVNAGKTTATDVKVRFNYITVTEGVSEEMAYQAALTLKQDPFTSTSVLAAGQPAELIHDSLAPIDEPSISSLSAKRIVIHAFLRVTYRDLFNREHVAFLCSRYEPNEQRMVNCASLTKAD